MDIKTELTQLKETVLKFMDGFKKEPLKYGSILTSDGKTVEFEGEMLTKGASVTIDGSPAEDGTYTLETGMTIVVAGGVVTEINDIEEEPATEMAEQFAAIQTKIECFEAKFSEVETRINGAIEKFQSSIETLAESMGKSLDLFEKFSETTPEPTQKPLNKKAVQKAEVNSRIEEIKKSLNK